MVNNVNAQKWLDEKYPIDGVCKRDNDVENNKDKKREEITELDIRKGKIGNGFFRKNKNLVGSLKLKRFANLRKLIISSHQLISLDVSDCSNLEELDCRSNELTSLNVSSCSSLKKIDCSNSHLKELDLSTCARLEEVNINNCPKELTENKGSIKSSLDYDAEKSKLVKGLAKNSPQINSVKEDDIRNILIIGITGSGKSALANTLSDKSDVNKFGEKDSGASVTKNFQTIEFE